jgi:hypothetical protein
MPIKSNAKLAADKKAAKAFITALADKVGGDPVELSFGDGEVNITVDGVLTTMSRTSFDNWLGEGAHWNGNGPASTPRPILAQPKPGTRKTKTTPPAPKRAPEPEAPAPTPKPKAKAQRKTADADDVIDSIVAEAFTIAQEERRGELMVRIQGISEASKVPVKKLLSMVNERSISLASQHSVPDFTPITEQEATTTRRVVQAFGSSGDFRYVDAIDPATGAPLVNDSGEPLSMPITEVAMNKLYPLVEYADEGSLDSLLSFAHRNTEKVVKAAKRVAKSLERPFMAVVDDVNALRTKKASPLGPEVGEVQVPPDEIDIISHLKGMIGEAPESDVVSLKTSRAWYDGTFVPLKELFSAIARSFMPDLVNQTTGQVSNVFVLERILTQFYNPFTDEGVQRVLGALVASGDLTESHAHEFVDSFAMNAENNNWERVVSGVVPEDSSALDDDGDLDDDDILGGDDPDIDSPEVVSLDDEDDFDDDLDDEDEL